MTEPKAPSKLESLKDAEESRLREFAPQAVKEFHDSVHGVYASSKEETRYLPTHIGSCMLLNVNDTPVILTAGHIITIARRTRSTLFIAGTVQLQLVPVTVRDHDIRMTTDPHSDCAFWRASDADVEALGAANFLPASRLAHNRSALDSRYYTAFGYAVSRNKKGVDHIERTIRVVPSMYTSAGTSDPALVTKLGLSANAHICVRFEQRAEDGDGATVNTFHPKGFSGGAFLDLGDFTSLGIYAGEAKGRARLAGMIIEYHKKHRALVAVQIGPIVITIRRGLGLSA